MLSSFHKPRELDWWKLKVHQRKIASENDFYWARQLKMTGTGEEQVINIFLDYPIIHHHHHYFVPKSS